MYEKRHLDALEGFVERSQEIHDVEFQRGFDEGHDAGIRDEIASRKLTQSLQLHVGIQTDLIEPEQVDLPPEEDIFFTPTAVYTPLPLTSEVGLQTSPPISSIPLPTLAPSLLLSPSPISSTLIPIATPVPSSSPKLSWADDSAPLPLIRAPRDFSALRSNNKPFSTLRHRNQRRYQTARRASTPPVRFPSSNTNIPILLHRRPPSCRYPHFSPPLPRLNVATSLPPALDWDCDPRLSDLWDGFFHQCPDLEIGFS